MLDENQRRFNKLLKAMVKGEPPKGRKAERARNVAKQKADKPE